MDKVDRTFTDTWATRSDNLDGQDYREYLQSQRWRDIKAKARKRPSYQKCNICGVNHNLDLHHTSYRYLGTERELMMVIALCRICHQKVHDLAKSAKISVRLATCRYRKMYNSGIKDVSELDKREAAMAYIEANGGHTRENLESLGLEWPFLSGWRKGYLRGYPQLRTKNRPSETS